MTACISICLWLVSFSSPAQAQTTFDACKLSKTNLSDTTFLQKNAAKIMKSSKDDCVLALLDTLTNRAVRSKGEAYIICLEAFAKAGDGYVSEYFWDVGTQLFEHRFTAMFTRMYDAHINKRANPLERVLIHALSMKISDSGNRKATEKEINTHFDSQIRKSHFIKAQLDYLAAVRKKIDPAIFD